MNDLKLADISTNNALSGKYKISVVDSNDNVVENFPWQKNLILNQGMDAVPNNTYQSLMYYAAGGNGTRLNSIYSSDSSASVAGNIIRLVPGILSGSIQSFTGSYGGYYSVVQAGDIIKFNDASEAQVLDVSNMSASLTATNTITTQSFTVWKTSQVGLQSEHQRVGASNWFIGAGYCGTTTVNTTSSVVTQLRRTWDFNYETASFSYTEVAVGWYNAGNNTIFSRVLLPSPVFIDVNQKLRLLYELDVSSSPTALYPGYPFTASIAGWGTGSIVYGHQSVDTILLEQINVNGTPVGYTASEPSSTSNTLSHIFVSNSSSSYIGGDKGGSSADLSSTLTIDAYIPGSYTLYKQGSFTVSQLNRNDLRTIGIGTHYSGYPEYYPWNPNFTAFFAVFTENQTKTNIQTLSLSWVWTWGRTLS